MYLIKSICLSVLFVLILSACGGGSSGKKSEPITNMSSAVFSAATSSSIASSSFSVSSSSTSSISSSIETSESIQSSSVLSVGVALVPVNNKSLTAPVFQVTPAPLSVQKNENLSLRWVAFSAEGELKNVNWTQLSGPAVTLKTNQNTLSITAGDVGNVVLEGRVSDKNGAVASTKIVFAVIPSFSSKAKLLQGNSNGQGIDLVIVGDGFLAEDQAQLEIAAQDVLRYIFEYDDRALMRYKSFFNVWLVESISSTRNISQHGYGGDTLFSAYFNCGNIARLLCADDQKVINFVAQHVPQYDQVLVLVNSDVYGGAGGLIATASLNSDVKNVVLHELGHSLVHLADEYDDEGVASLEEPIEVNVTANTNPLTVKWNYWFSDKNMIPGFNKYTYSKNEVGYFVGGYYAKYGIWRPTYESIMRVLNGPFGSVNKEAWALSVWSYYPINTGFLPASNEFSKTDKPLIFSVPVTIGVGDTRVTWWINDVKIDTGSANQVLILTAIDETIRSVKVTVEDNTQFIRRDLKGVSKLQYTWSIH